MKIRWLTLLLAIGLAAEASGDTIYATWAYAGDASSLTRFDSATPWLFKDPFPPEVQVPLVTIDFDPVTRKIWGFDYSDCQIPVCPPLNDPVVIDPLTGAWSFVPLPGLNLHEFVLTDRDIDPLTRELRHFTGPTGNASYSFDRLQDRYDAPLHPVIGVTALAHRQPTSASQGVETYAIGPSPRTGPKVRGEPWFQLARIGGPGGTPPASSGEVTIIGPVDVDAERLWFDISADGTAYLAALVFAPPYNDEYKLYRVDLTSGALVEIGLIAQPGGSAILCGISVAPPGLGEGVVAIPALSRVGLGLFALALGTAALRVAGRKRVAASV